MAAILLGGAACGGDGAPADITSSNESELLAAGAAVFIARRGTWWYWNGGEDFGTAWTEHSWDHPAGQKSGTAPLGYGESYLNETISFGSDPANKPITVYFRKAFFVEDPARVASLRLDAMYDDGLVFYINGREGGRVQMPAGAIISATLSLGNEANNTYVSFDASSARSALQVGWNTLAIEVHQKNRGSSDLVFDASLVAQIEDVAPPPQEPPPPAQGAIARGSPWRYWDRGGDLGTAWRGGSFDDASWGLGAGPLGYGETYLATTVAYGGSAASKYITTYFRKQFVVSDPANVGAIRGELMYDDGVVVYLNGQPIERLAMPSGNITATTLAGSSEANNRYSSHDWTAAKSHLVVGVNTLAVELHQKSPWSSDLVFDLALELQAGAPTDPRDARRNIDTFMIHYDRLTPAVVAVAKSYELVILDPFMADLSRAKVADIQRGINPAEPGDDVLVLCYVSIGEDRRTAWYSDSELANNPLFRGDRSGPRVDPRGPAGSGGSLQGIDPRGIASPAGTGYASYYLDDNDVLRNGVGDGRPDRNTWFGGAFVNMGDPLWYEVVNRMTIDGPDRLAGLAEALTTSHGRGIGCDGVFLDTLDTAAPNHFTDLGSANPSQFEWTAPGAGAFLRRLRADYPDKLVVQNRGLFFFDPRHWQFEFTTGAYVDYVLFESFRLDSSSAHEFYPFFHADNRYNLAPKLMAEANRGRGFQVLSLGYAEGPPDLMRVETLTGQSTIGLASLLEDIRVAQTVTGFRHYLSNGSINWTNTFVRDHSSLDDAVPPVWTSTYNGNNRGYPVPPDPPTPRVGIQEITAGPRRLTVRWDVALDLHRVRYAAYIQDHPFDFAADPMLARAVRQVLTPRMGRGYFEGVGPGLFPYEADLTGLAAGRTYHVVIRAFDESSRRNEERNQRVLFSTPTP